jgi:hypothetical protein
MESLVFDAFVTMFRECYFLVDANAGGIDFCKKQMK